MLDQYYCLGLRILGSCAYNPEKPTFVFTIGQLASVLSILIVISQFSKPIQKFRVDCHPFRGKIWVPSIILTGACVLISNVLPIIPGEALPILGYPIIWEVLAGVIFGASIFNHIIVLTKPVKFTLGKAEIYLKASEALIRKGEQSDLNEYANELSENLTAAHNSIKGIDFFFSPDKPAKEELATYHLFALWSDSALCKCIAEKHVNLTAELVRCANDGLSHRIGGRMFEQILSHSIRDPNSLFNRNSSASSHRFFQQTIDSLFSDPDFLRGDYDPINAFPIDRFDYNEKLVKYYTKCLLAAFQANFKSPNSDRNVMSPLNAGLEMINGIFQEEIFSENALKPKDRRIRTSFYISNFYSDLIDSLAEIQYDARHDQIINKLGESYAEYFGWVSRSTHNEFSHYISIFGLWNKLYSSKDDRNEIISKISTITLTHLNDYLKRNYSGSKMCFPPITRFYMNIFGVGPGTDRSDAKITEIRDAYITKLKTSFGGLWMQYPDIAKAFLPESAKYDPDTKTITKYNAIGDATEIIID